MGKLIALLISFMALLVSFAFAGNNLPGGTRKADEQDAAASLSEESPKEGKKEAAEKKKSAKPSPTPSKSE